MGDMKLVDETSQSPKLYDPTAPAFRKNPFPVLHRLRDVDPIHRTSWGWILSRYGDCAKVLGSREFGMRGIRERLRTALGSGAAFEFISRRFQFIDPPEHARIRSLTTKAFSARRVLDMRPRIQRLVDQLLDEVNGAQGFDVIAAVAYPLPAWVISEMLGTPVEDRERLAAWTAPITRLQEPGPFDPALLAAGDLAAAEFMAYVRALIDERRRRAGEDLLSALIAAEESGDRLSLEELVAGVIFLFNAGHHTTRDLIGNALVALLRHRDQWELLVSEPSLIPGAVEECLRYDPSITRTPRFALVDTELDGRKVAAGEPVTCLLNAANRDPERFPEPDRLDIRRADKDHLAFGGGVHFCLGATLARLETEIVLGSLLRRHPGLHLVTEELEWRESITYRGPVAVRVIAK
jgi:cytochrome P450